MYPLKERVGQGRAGWAMTIVLIAAFAMMGMSLFKMLSAPAPQHLLTRFIIIPPFVVMCCFFAIWRLEYPHVFGRVLIGLGIVSLWVFMDNWSADPWTNMLVVLGIFAMLIEGFAYCGFWQKVFKDEGREFPNG
jgi:hypothetical protein